MNQEKEAFLQRLKNVHQLLTQAGCPSLDNCSLFNALCDAGEGVSQPTSDPNTETSTKSFMCNKEIFYRDLRVSCGVTDVNVPIIFRSVH